jgi:hypothetical protein
MVALRTALVPTSNRASSPPQIVVSARPPALAVTRRRLLAFLPVLAPGVVTASGCAQPRGQAPAVTVADQRPAARLQSREPFENPGGMWTPEQMNRAEHRANLRRLGAAFDPAVLAAPDSPLLGAVVSLGGCSAAFVSPDGLIATNHHCVRRDLQYHSTGGRNLDRDGYLARTRAEELWNGPSARVYVTLRASDVTDEILDGLTVLSDPLARFRELERRKKALIADCETQRAGLRCAVPAFHGGGEYQLIEQLELRDVRLVYAPPRGIGNYGGDEDNWMWPRHTGDFALLRAYVAPDGGPGDHAGGNVPYTPRHHLPVSRGDLDAGDLVLVAGYPGQTAREATAAELAEAIDWRYPREIAAATEYIALLSALRQRSSELEIKTGPLIYGMQNRLKNRRGVLEGLRDKLLLEEKQRREAELTAWMAQVPARQAAHGSLLPRLAELQAEQEAGRERAASLAELASVSLLGAALTIHRVVMERARPDAERKLGYQDRDRRRLLGEQKALAHRYHPEIDRAMLTLALERAARNPRDNRDWLRALVGSERPSSRRIAAAVDRLYARTRLADEELRLGLFDASSLAELEQHRDPMLRWARLLLPQLLAEEARQERLQGERALLMPGYLAARREFSGRPIAPDANGTLRITYGTVRGYRPGPDAPFHTPFTSISGVVAKHRDAEPFDAPEPLLAAARAGQFGQYADPELGDLPVDFLADLDITGGNSGSATINRRGELVGLVFDGNYESLASSWLFTPELTRSIHVDIRYALWVLDALDGADRLLRELGVPRSGRSDAAPTSAALPPAR